MLLRRPRWAVVAKPGGLACHRSELVRDRDTLVRRARARFGQDVLLVHRLDRAASGCLLVAFDREAAAQLKDALVSVEATKAYLALVRGHFKWDDPVLVDTDVKGDDGFLRPAATLVSALGRSHDPRCSLLLARPRTGRNHQVRRHVRDLSHPILGDAVHGDTRSNRLWRETHALSRLALHCFSIDLPTGPDGPVSVWCPPPADLVALWSTLPWWPDAVRRMPRLAHPPLDLFVPDAR